MIENGVFSIGSEAEGHRLSVSGFTGDVRDSSSGDNVISDKYQRPVSTKNNSRLWFCF